MNTNHPEPSLTLAKSIGSQIIEPLTDLERQLYKEHEEAIAANLNTFVEIGERLFDIRDRRLYREQFKTFEEYCRTRWKMSRQRANQLIQGFEVIHRLSTEMTTIGCQSDPAKLLPTTERQARELVKVPSEERAAVMHKATKGGTVESTSRSIRLAAAKRELQDHNQTWMRDSISLIRRHGSDELADAILVQEVKISVEEIHKLANLAKQARPDLATLAPQIVAAGRFPLTDQETTEFKLRNKLRSLVAEVIKRWEPDIGQANIDRSRPALQKAITEAPYRDLVALIGFEPDSEEDFEDIDRERINEAISICNERARKTPGQEVQLSIEDVLVIRAKVRPSSETSEAGAPELGMSISREAALNLHHLTGSRRNAKKPTWSRSSARRVLRPSSKSFWQWARPSRISLMATVSGSLPCTRPDRLPPRSTVQCT
jgi:hypothetical protein